MKRNLKIIQCPPSKIADGEIGELLANFATNWVPNAQREQFIRELMEIAARFALDTIATLSKEK